MEESRANSNAQRAENDDSSQPGNRPVAKFKHGGIELAVFANQGENGTMYNTKITRRQFTGGRIKSRDHTPLLKRQSAMST